jgi:hypothetical protein
MPDLLPARRRVVAQKGGCYATEVDVVDLVHCCDCGHGALLCGDWLGNTLDWLQN